MHLYCPSSIYKNNRYTKKVYYIIVVGFVVAVFFIGLVWCFFIFLRRFFCSIIISMLGQLI